MGPLWSIYPFKRRLSTSGIVMKDRESDVFEHISVRSISNIHPSGSTPSGRNLVHRGRRSATANRTPGNDQTRITPAVETPRSVHGRYNRQFINSNQDCQPLSYPSTADNGEHRLPLQACSRPRDTLTNSIRCAGWSHLLPAPSDQASFPNDYEPQQDPLTCLYLIMLSEPCRLSHMSQRARAAGPARLAMAREALW